MERCIKKYSRGFTLIELLVVIAIIGVLSGIILTSLNDSRTRARDTKRVTELKQLKTALEMYYLDYGCYPRGGGGSTLATPCPTGNSTLVPPGCTTVNTHFNNSLQVLVSGGYISSLPVDPLNQSLGGKDYCYNYSRVGPDTSGWLCGGVVRTLFSYSISFSTEKATLNLPVNNQNQYDYCILGDRVL